MIPTNGEERSRSSKPCARNRPNSKKENRSSIPILKPVYEEAHLVFQIVHSPQSFHFGTNSDALFMPAMEYPCHLAAIIPLWN